MQEFKTKEYKNIRCKKKNNKKKKHFNSILKKNKMFNQLQINFIKKILIYFKKNIIK